MSHTSSIVSININAASFTGMYEMIKRSGSLIIQTRSNETMYYLRFDRRSVLRCSRKKEVEEPVMPLEPGKEKEKHAADVVTERK